MGGSPLLALGIAVAALPWTQETTKPVVVTPAGDPAPPGGGIETGAANQQALSATARQTARIAQDRDTNARDQAAYAKAQADFVRNSAAYEAEKAAVTRRNADEAEAYRRRLAAWRQEVDARSRPAHRPADAAAARRERETPIVCTSEVPTGSRVPVRVCR